MKKPLIDTYLTNGNITIFLGEHTKQFKDDILHTHLYAQLFAAMRGTDKNTTWSAYEQMVSNLYWITKSTEQRTIDFRNTSLLSIVQQNVRPALQEDDMHAIAITFSGLKKIPADSEIIKTLIKKIQSSCGTTSSQSFPEHSKTTASAHTMLTIVCKNKTVISLQISFSTTNPFDTNILDQPILNSIKAEKNNFRMLCSTLEQKAYQEIREVIIDKLHDKTKTELFQIQIPTDTN